MPEGPKKKELVSSLATLDSAAGALLAAQEEGLPLAAALTNLAEGRLFPTDVRSSVDALREERGEWTREELEHDAIRRVNETLQRSPSWEVLRWREVERKETRERVFEVMLLGVELPVDGEELIPSKRRGEEVEEASAEPTDFCTCAHTRGSHFELRLEEGGGFGKCSMNGCPCGRFELMGSGMTKLKVEEMPPPPESDLPERPALNFIEDLFREASLDPPDPLTFMALQRLVSQGWRVLAPDKTTTGDEHE